MKKPTLVKDKPAKEPKQKATKSSTTAGSNALDPEMRALFLKDKEDYAKAKEKLGKAQAAIRLIGKTIKADGFTMRQIKLAIQLETPEGEAEFKSLVANDLLAAQYAGAQIGSQLQLFLEPDRTPAVDRAFDEGTQASMEGKSAKPPYDPATPQAAKWLEGFHSDTERRVKAGITKPTSAEMN
jgi:ribosome modulation factor